MKKGMRKKSDGFVSLQKKISRAIAMLVIFCNVSLGVISAILIYNSSMNSIKQTIDESSALASQYVAKSLGEYVAVAYESGSIARLANPEISVEEKSNILQQRIEDHNFTDGFLLGADGVDLINGYDLSEKDYFIEAMKGNTYISTPEHSSITGEVSFVVAAPLWEGGIPHTTPVGVIVYVPDGEFLNNIMRSIQVGKHGTAFMVDANGITIAELDSSLVGVENCLELGKTDAGLRKFSKIVEKMVAGEDGVDTYTYGGVQKVVAYSPVPDSNGWSICIAARKNDFLTGFYVSLVVIAVLIGLFTAAGIRVGNNIGKRIAEPIARSVDRLKLLAMGDLHSETDKMDTHDETQILTENLAATISNLNLIIADIRNVLGELSSGNFSVGVDKNYEGDFSEISNSLRNIGQSLKSAMKEIDGNADKVNNGSIELSKAAQQLAEGATDQASAIEELTATIESISEKINDNAEHATGAKDIVEHMNRDIMTSNTYMNKMSDAMVQIKDASAEISNIMKTIEDIASQTNLLSLNASIEAARAGEAGKGFAVVANEVGNLAEQSAQAAKNTAILIQNSLNAVDEGAHLATETADSLQVVVEHSRRIEETVSEIASASEEQALAAGQISEGINQIAGVVENNSATAEESAASSSELSTQANALKTLLEKFKF